ncbi:MAG TPA: bifunctional [glutamate--ammonia ligase]-adenylyl-L-tyrosine phosphorylase/[glutamate--ammonia-ligase] adenylyltransferase, partial [Burkholderiales bacterium]|nr:bifunctional [glutamate--ammonia ligase]-adenylyl-L-tyrosine phosphorylase/[glutamate--ammonia-ligase] adenylyltransferase [Burkholderiales bacterium]
MRKLAAHPPLLFVLDTLTVPCGRCEIRAWLQAQGVATEEQLRRRLREVRQAALLRVITRDLNGLADLSEVMRSVTALAEEALRFALRLLHLWMQETYGVPRGAGGGQAQELVVVGMGKLGGEELNVSSDIDLVFLYPEAGETDGARPISNQEYFTRLSRRLIGALSEYTADGQVFRVDTRLRPYGESGPLVMSYDMLEDYLHAHGRDWERYAWIKARVVSESSEPALESIVTPFVFRRYLDYSAIASLRGLHAQIRAEVARRELHDDVKLGPGGIREIEFIAQVFQLVRGGQDASLRLRPTVATLQRLAELRLLPSDAAADLHAAYAFLRNLEHRLQYLDDEQTQRLPASAEDRAIVARAMGHADYAALIGQLDRQRDAVTRQFEAIFAGQSASEAADPLSGLWSGAMDEDERVERLAQLGYLEPKSVVARLRQLREGQAYRRMAASTQALVDRLAPRVIEAAAGFEHPDQTLERLTRVLESIGRRESYFALLLEFPG